MRICAFFLATASLCFTADAPRTYTGTIEDDMCGGDHKHMGGTDAAKCTAECVKSMGAKYALITDVGGKKEAYVLSDQKKAAKFANKNVSVTGTLSGKTLTAKSIAPAASTPGK